MLGHLIMTPGWRFGNIHSNAYFKTLCSCTVAFLFSFYIIPTSLNVSTNTEAVAQLSPSTPASPTASGLPTIQISSVQEGQQVPPGELTIQGVSSDTEDTDCEVFADVNDVTPMQNVTAAGGDDEDFSTWTFTYSEDYQLISPGQNELTAKISCPPDEGPGFSPPAGGLDTGTPAASSASLDEWHTVNVTGVEGAPPATLSSSATGADGADGAEGIDGEDSADGADGLGGSGGDDGDGGEDTGDGGEGGDGGDGGDGGGAGTIDPPSLFG
jgi:hypothetical protein